MRRVIITGPTGTIGIALIQELIQQNIEVLAICHRNSRRIQDIPKSSLVHMLELNLDELSKLKQLKGNEKYDVFFHLGWDGTFGNTRDNVQEQLNNVQYTLDAVRTAHELGCKRFIGVGSQAEYGRVTVPLNAMTPTHPENGYGMAKLCAGQMSRLLAQQLEIEHIWVRVLSIYGPYDGENTMIMSTIHKLLRGERPLLTKGEQIWDYLYCKDAARLLTGIAENGRNGKTYCLGSGQGRPLKEYIEQIRDEIDPNLALGFGEISYGEKQVMYLVADTSDLVQDIGMSADTKFSKGIKETIKWVRKRM